MTLPVSPFRKVWIIQESDDGSVGVCLSLTDADEYIWIRNAVRLYPEDRPEGLEIQDLKRSAVSGDATLEGKETVVWARGDTRARIRLAKRLLTTWMRSLAIGLRTRARCTVRVPVSHVVARGSVSDPFGAAFLEHREPPWRRL